MTSKLQLRKTGARDAVAEYLAVYPITTTAQYDSPKFVRTIRDFLHTKSMAQRTTRDIMESGAEFYAALHERIVLQRLTKDEVSDILAGDFENPLRAMKLQIQSDKELLAAFGEQVRMWGAATNHIFTFSGLNRMCEVHETLLVWIRERMAEPEWKWEEVVSSAWGMCIAACNIIEEDAAAAEKAAEMVAQQAKEAAEKVAEKAKEAETVFERLSAARKLAPPTKSAPRQFDLWRNPGGRPSAPRPAKSLVGPIRTVPKFVPEVSAGLITRHVESEYVEYYSRNASLRLSPYAIPDRFKPDQFKDVRGPQRLLQAAPDADLPLDYDPEAADNRTLDELMDPRCAKADCSAAALATGVHAVSLAPCGPETDGAASAAPCINGGNEPENDGSQQLGEVPTGAPTRPSEDVAETADPTLPTEPASTQTDDQDMGDSHTGATAPLQPKDDHGVMTIGTNVQGGALKKLGPEGELADASAEANGETASQEMGSARAGVEDPLTLAVTGSGGQEEAPTGTPTGSSARASQTNDQELSAEGGDNVQGAALKKLGPEGELADATAEASEETVSQEMGVARAGAEDSLQQAVTGPGGQEEAPTGLSTGSSQCASQAGDQKLSAGGDVPASTKTGAREPGNDKAENQGPINKGVSPPTPTKIGAPADSSAGIPEDASKRPTNETSDDAPTTTTVTTRRIVPARACKRPGQNLYAPAAKLGHRRATKAAKARAAPRISSPPREHIGEETEDELLEHLADLREMFAQEDEEVSEALRPTEQESGEAMRLAEEEEEEARRLLEEEEDDDELFGEHALSGLRARSPPLNDIGEETEGELLEHQADLRERFAHEDAEAAKALRLAEQEATEALRVAEEEEAEALRLAEEKEAAALRLAEQEAEALRLAEEKEAAALRLAEQEAESLREWLAEEAAADAAETVRIAEMQAAEARRVAQEDEDDYLEEQMQQAMAASRLAAFYANKPGQPSGLPPRPSPRSAGQKRDRDEETEEESGSESPKRARLQGDRNA